MIQELSLAFDKIKKLFFQEDKWFINVREDFRKVEFGDAIYKYSLYIMEGNHLIVSPYDSFRTPKDITIAIGKIISEELSSNNIDAIISSEEIYSTSEKSETIKNIFSYLLTELRKNKSVRVPYYSIIPSLTVDGYVLILDNNHNIVTSLKSMEDAELLVANEVKDISMMRKAEEELKEWLCSLSDNVVTYIREEYNDNFFYIPDGFVTKYSFVKKVESQTVSYHSNYVLGDDCKSFSCNVLQNVIEHTVKEIKAYVSSTINEN